MRLGFYQPARDTATRSNPISHLSPPVPTHPEGKSRQNAPRELATRSTPRPKHNPLPTCAHLAPKRARLAPERAPPQSDYSSPLKRAPDLYAAGAGGGSMTLPGTSSVVSAASSARAAAAISASIFSDASSRLRFSAVFEARFAAAYASCESRE